MRARSGITVPWASYTVRPSTRQAAVDAAPVERDLARAKPGEVVVEVLVRRLDHVVERLACSATAQAQLLVQREHAGGGAADGEHALGHGEVEDVKGRHSPAVVPRFPADVLDREVDGERRRPIRRQLEPARSRRRGTWGCRRPETCRATARSAESSLAPRPRRRPAPRWGPAGRARRPSGAAGAPGSSARRRGPAPRARRT